MSPSQLLLRNLIETDSNLPSMSRLLHSKIIPAGLGLLTHLAANNREWDHYGHVILLGGCALLGALVVIEYITDPGVGSFIQAAGIVRKAAVVYLATLLTSMTIYRAAFHRLRKFPGPFLARCTKFHTIACIIPNLQFHNVVEGFHKKYRSDIVRTGPRELSITSTEAIALIHGPASNCGKSLFYSAPHHVEGASLQSTRDPLEHKERRKSWNHAFSTKALQNYESRLDRHARMLMDKLMGIAHEPAVSISSWFSYFAFDVMGDIGYSRSFGMMENGKEDEWIALVHKSMIPMSVLTHLPWLASLLLRTPLQRDILNFIALVQKILTERAKITPAEPDVFSYLLDEYIDHVPKELNADSRLMVVAGSDTTYATLTWLVWELCTHKEVQTKLRRVINEIAPEKEFLDTSDLHHCPLLDGAINESLRLHPPVPSGVPRVTPSEGLTLPDGTYIPGETVVWMPIHTIQRDERYFISPLRFMPERWTEEASEYIQDRRAFMPFGTGPYHCVGQKLAMMEMRLVVANLLRSFEIEFAGDMGKAVVEKSIDAFVLCVGSLDVKLTPRNKGP